MFGERASVLTGLTMGALGFLIYGLAPTGRVFAVGIPVMGLFGLYGPAAQALMTRRVGPTEQGRLQGALSSVVGLTGIVGPGIFALTFSISISRPEVHLPGAAFILASLLLASAVAVAWRVTSRRA
jgi:DHA1 family tetracycline resistance protein-like MFS transporter